MLATVEGSNTSATVSYIHTDHLTGSALVTNSVGSQIQLLDYHPFGTIRINNQSTTFNEKRKFAGHEYDTETGLSYMQARYYDPATGRFISEDPAFLDIGAAAFSEKYQRSLEQHLQNPQFLNSYAYGLNNPVTFRDPQGEIVPLIILGAWAAVEFGLSAYDAYSTYQTLASSEAGGLEKAVTLGGFAAGLALPGGGYGMVGKQVVKHGDGVVGAVKAGVTVSTATPNASNYRGIFQKMFGYLDPETQVHHCLPQKYEKLFTDVGINIHDMRYLEAVPKNVHKKITNAWRSWDQAQNRNVTAKDVKNFANNVRGQFGKYFKSKK
jgi:RHS repeat-associated protein